MPFSISHFFSVYNDNNNYHHCCGVFVLPPIESGHVCTSFRCCYVTLARFGESGPPCARCSVGHLCLLKLVLNSGDEDPGLLMSAVASTQ